MVGYHPATGGASDIKTGIDIDGRPSKRDTDPGPREKDSMLMMYTLE